MRKIKIVSNNGSNTVYVNGTPNLGMLSKQDYDALISSLELILTHHNLALITFQDYDALISSLELEIRNYYKGRGNKEDGNKFGQPP